MWSLSGWAGQIDIAGTLDRMTLPTGVASPYAEWNAFWDPDGTQQLHRELDVPERECFRSTYLIRPKVTPAFLAQLLVDGKTQPAF